LLIGITGGIASGKSSFTSRLSLCLSRQGGQVAVFNADAAARELLSRDAEIQRRVREIFGELDRARLRELVFHDEPARKRLESILHPPVIARWREMASQLDPKTWFLSDIPLLYETGLEGECDRVVVVACRGATQIERIVSQRGLTPALASQMIASQACLASKVARADDVVWNDDAPLSRLDEQAELFAEILFTL